MAEYSEFLHLVVEARFSCIASGKAGSPWNYHPETVYKPLSNTMLELNREVDSIHREQEERENCERSNESSYRRRPISFSRAVFHIFNGLEEDPK